MFNILIVRPLINETRDYCARVKAEGGFVEAPFAIDTYFRALIDANIWNSLGSACSFIGGTFPICFVPFRNDMPIPDNVGPFVEGDQNVVTGLKGNAIDKAVNTNRNNNATPQNSQHLSVYITELHTSGTAGGYIGAGDESAGASIIARSGATPANLVIRNRNNTVNTITSAGSDLGFVGMRRSNSTQATLTTEARTETVARTSSTPFDGNIRVFNTGTMFFTDARIAMYTEGESVLLTPLRDIQVAFKNDVAQEAS
jgi:hypothetical protein